MAYTVEYVTKDKSVASRSPPIGTWSEAKVIAVDGLIRHAAAYARIIDRE